MGVEGLGGSDFHPLKEGKGWLVAPFLEAVARACWHIWWAPVVPATPDEVRERVRPHRFAAAALAVTFREAACATVVRSEGWTGRVVWGLEAAFFWRVEALPIRAMVERV